MPRLKHYKDLRIPNRLGKSNLVEKESHGIKIYYFKEERMESKKASSVTFDYIPEKNCIEIFRLHVVDVERSYHIGRLFLKEVENYARKHGVLEIRLDAQKFAGEKKHPLKFYLKNGFKVDFRKLSRIDFFARYVIGSRIPMVKYLK